MGSWVYIRSEAKLFTVGFHDPAGRWHPDSDWGSSDEASRRVSFLNGCPDAPLPFLTVAGADAILAALDERDKLWRLRDVAEDAVRALVDLGACPDPQCTEPNCLHVLPNLVAALAALPARGWKATDRTALDLATLTRAVVERMPCPAWPNCEGDEGDCLACDRTRAVLAALERAEHLETGLDRLAKALLPWPLQDGETAFDMAVRLLQRAERVEALHRDGGRCDGLG